MKQLLKILFLVILTCCYACSKDTPSINRVRVEVEANSDEPIRIYGTKSDSENGIVIRKHYDTSFETDAEVFSIDARCKDEKTLIRIKVWVNGRFKVQKDGNKYVTTGDIWS